MNTHEPIEEANGHTPLDVIHEEDKDMNEIDDFFGGSNMQMFKNQNNGSPEPPQFQNSDSADGENFGIRSKTIANLKLPGASAM